MRLLLLAVALLAEGQLGSRALPLPTLFLARDYQANEVAADARYKDRRLFLRGNITGVNVVGRQAEVVLFGYDETHVRCLVAKPWPAIVTELRPDDHVVLRGVVRGIDVVNVRIEPCAVLTIEPPATSR